MNTEVQTTAPQETVTENLSLAAVLSENSKPGKPVQKSKQTKDYEPISSIKDYLIRHYYFRYNQIGNKIEFRRLDQDAADEDGVMNALKPFTDADFNSIFLNLQRDMEFKLSKDTLRIVLNSDFVPSYNPLVEYFNDLPRWDGETDYIEQLAARVRTTNDVMFLKYFKIWLTSTVACALNPKIANHTVLLFKGAQGRGKTRFLRNLIPQSLEQYLYEGVLVPNNKDHERMLAEKLLIIMDEFDSKTDRHMEAMKSLITRETISLRKPYGTNSEDMTRVASFTGTTNKDHFLKDSTGSRRFIVIEVEEFTSSDRYEHLDRAYAQALTLRQNGGKFYLDNEDIEELNQHNESFTHINAEKELIEEHIRKVAAGETPDDSFTATQITKRLCEVSPFHFSARLVQKIGVTLNELGIKGRKSNGSSLYDIKWVTK